MKNYDGNKNFQNLFQMMTRVEKTEALTILRQE
jgi:hypothetical protein